MPDLIVPELDTSHQARLRTIVVEITALLAEAASLQGSVGSPLMWLQAAEKYVALTSPAGARKAQETAVTLFRNYVHDKAREVMRDHEDHSRADLIHDALNQLAHDLTPEAALIVLHSFHAALPRMGGQR